MFFTIRRPTRSTLFPTRRSSDLIAATGDFGQSGNCPASLAANASCSIFVTFTPTAQGARTGSLTLTDDAADSPQSVARSEEHTSELQSHVNLVCRLLLEKKKTTT